MTRSQFVHIFQMALASLVFLVVSLGSSSGAQAQIDPLLLGRAVDATVQLSIVVDGFIDGEEKTIWYAVGSGTIVTVDGLILTNQHLIAPDRVQEKLAELESELAAEGQSADVQLVPGQFMIAVSDGRHLPAPRYVARVVKENEALDLAVLRIEGDERNNPIEPPLALPILPLGNSDTVNLGDAVHVFGFPAIGSGSLTYTRGVVSGFLYEEGIDGTAWINTDAVTSGGNSGGAAINAAGELIGIPTSGSALDCRPGDTNRDGVEGPGDVGCVPTGGSLTQLRPIDLALPLLAAVDPALAESNPGAEASVSSETDELAGQLAAAEGCAARGDWRCAVNFFVNALAIAPDDSAIVGSLYDAYLSLGQQEAAAGRLASARSAFANAAETDPSRPAATMALDRIAPYRSAIFIDAFDGPENFVALSDGSSISSYDDGAFTIELSQPGLVSGYPLTPKPLAGEDYAAWLRVGRATGDGMVMIETRTDPAGGQWVFAVDPTRRTWEVLQFDIASGQFTPWTGPHGYETPGDDELDTVELRVTDGFPLLLVNGFDVAAAAGEPLPEVGNAGEISFGAVMSSQGTVPFAVAFDEIALYELT